MVGTRYGLRRLFTLSHCCRCSDLGVFHLRLTPQAAATEGSCGKFETQLLELDTCAIALHCQAPAVEEHNLATTAGLQVC